MQSRAPRGARGLKFPDELNNNVLFLSRPARGAWIEINATSTARCQNIVAPREGRVD